MFEGCSSLQTTIILNAENSAPFCYSQMFYGCTSLTTAPYLKSTELSDNCYYRMFEGCTGLKSIPKLETATSVGNYSYYQMFKGCTSLKISNESSAGTAFFTCPDTSGHLSVVKNMFKETGGSFKGTPESGQTYYLVTETEKTTEANSILNTLPAESTSKIIPNNEIKTQNGEFLFNNKQENIINEKPQHNVFYKRYSNQ